MPDPTSRDADSAGPWYAGVTRYEWLVLAIASAGWIFDIYEGQIFNITRTQMLADLGSSPAEIKWYGDLFLSIFLLGGTVGGLVAGTLADRMGRRPVMVATILMYSVFSGLTYFATELWQVAALRFFVAIGTGGEWAVAASLVAEVFPSRARAHASGIFHASSVLGTWMAALVGMAVGADWRYAYLFGIAPALLILWVRTSVREPERWQAKAAAAQGGAAVHLGRFRDLLFAPPWNRRAWLGMALAAVGLGTFWAVTVAGQDLARVMLLGAGAASESADGALTSLPWWKNPKFAYGIVQTIGGGLGLLSFGPISARIGRRLTFVLFHLLAFATVLVTCFWPDNYGQLLAILPVFGFFTLGMHAGYAIYFPELFPTHLRATGTSFCFNGGRAAAAVLLIFSGALKAAGQAALPMAVAGMGTLFLVGAVLMLFLPETRGGELPE